MYVRVAVSNEHAEIDLSKKFGAIIGYELPNSYAQKLYVTFNEHLIIVYLLVICTPILHIFAQLTAQKVPRQLRSNIK